MHNIKIKRIKFSVNMRPTMKYKTMCLITGTIFAFGVLVYVSLCHTVTQYPPPPPTDLSNLGYVIHNDVCRDDVSGVPIVAVMMVTSYMGNVKKRTIMREAYPAALLESIGIRRAFVLATLHQDTEKDRRSSISEEDIIKESQLYKDIVQVNFTEAYRKTTYKNLMGMRYAVTYCSNASFVVKSDDDIIFDIYQMLDLLKTKTKEDRDDIMGHFWNEAQPYRNPRGRYYVTFQEYPDSTYPYYAWGFLFITSLNTTRLLVETSKLVPFLWIDDILITGLIAKKAGVRQVQFGDTVGIDSTLQCCRNDSVVYKCAQMAALHHDVKDDTLFKRISVHAGFCYTHNTCQVLGEIDKGKLTCF